MIKRWFRNNYNHHQHKTHNNLKLTWTKQFTLNIKSTQKHRINLPSPWLESFAARFPVYVENTLAARTSVIGVLEKVHEEWNQATSQQQSETKSHSLSWFKTDWLQNFSDKSPLTHRTQRQHTWTRRKVPLCMWPDLWLESDRKDTSSNPESDAAAFHNSQTLAGRWNLNKWGDGRYRCFQLGLPLKQRYFSFC